MIYRRVRVRVRGSRLTSSRTPLDFFMHRGCRHHLHSRIIDVPNIPPDCQFGRGPLSPGQSVDTAITISGAIHQPHRRFNRWSEEYERRGTNWLGARQCIGRSDPGGCEADGADARGADVLQVGSNQKPK